MERLPTILMIAWLLPLLSFAVICIGYTIPQMFGIRVRYATQKIAAYIAIGAIVTGFVLSAYGLFGLWLPNNKLPAPAHHEEHQPDEVAAQPSPFRLAALQVEHAEGETIEGGEHHGTNG